MQISSRDFNQDLGKAKKASRTSPVIITERGKAAHVLLSYQHYERLVKAQPSMAQMLCSDDEIEFEFEKAALQLKEVDFS